MCCATPPGRSSTEQGFFFFLPGEHYCWLLILFFLLLWWVGVDCEWKKRAGNMCVASFDWSCSGVCKSVERRMRHIHQAKEQTSGTLPYELVFCRGLAGWVTDLVAPPVLLQTTQLVHVSFPIPDRAANGRQRIVEDFFCKPFLYTLSLFFLSHVMS
jgi:hypothetical protein